MTFGMDDLMDSMYERDPNKKKAAAQRVADDPNIKKYRMPTESMRDMIDFVSENYYGGSPTSKQQLNEQSVPRRTRANPSQQPSQDTLQKLQEAFNGFLRAFDRIVNEGQSPDDPDVLWESVVEYVDNTWDDYTNRGILPNQ